MTRRLTDHQEPGVLTAPIDCLMPDTWRNLQTLAGKKQAFHALRLQRHLPRKHVEELPRALVHVPHLLDPGRHALLDHAQSCRPQQMPAVAAGALRVPPSIVLRRLSAYWQPAVFSQYTITEELLLFHVCPGFDGTFRRSATLRRRTLFTSLSLRSSNTRAPPRPNTGINEMLSTEFPGNRSSLSPDRTQNRFAPKFRSVKKHARLRGNGRLFHDPSRFPGFPFP